MRSRLSNECTAGRPSYPHRLIFIPVLDLMLMNSTKELQVFRTRETLIANAVRVRMMNTDAVTVMTI